MWPGTGLRFVENAMPSVHCAVGTEQRVGHECLWQVFCSLRRRFAVIQRGARMRYSYAWQLAPNTMGEPLAIRRRWRLMPVVTPPRGLWRHLVKSPKPAVADAELELVLRERKRKWEQISHPCVRFSSHGSECAFCIVHNVWPPCGLRQPKRTRTSPSTSPKR